MIAIIGWWEFALALGVLALAVAELVGLMTARRAGLTKNVSRLVTHGLMILLSAVYAWLAVWWTTILESATVGLTGSRFGIANWGFLVLAVLLGLVIYELVAQIWAMHIGYTRSIPRLVTHVAMATIVTLMLMMNLTRWQVYRSEVLAGSGEAEVGSGLLQAVGWWELVLVAGVVLLARNEFLGLVAARRAGKTQNVSRLVVYGLLTGLAVIYAVIEVRWARGLETADSLALGGHPAIAEWGLVVLAALLFLALYAVATMAWARQFGLTHTVGRLVSNLVLASFVVLVVAINLTRWQMYFGILEESYQESIRSGGVR